MHAKLGMVKLTAVAGALAAFAGCADRDTDGMSVPVADIILVGDNIIPMDGSEIEAVAVSGELITATGSREDILAHKGDETRVIELGDHALLPGFIDSHSHVTAVANLIEYTNLSSPPVGEVTSISGLIENLSASAEGKSLEPGEWIVGYGYDDSLLTEKRHPTRDDLDKVSTERPVAIIHVSGHLAVANSAALEELGINEGSEDPAGGIIQREAGSSRPNGVLEENAAYGVLGKTFLGTPDNLAEKTQLALDAYASEGFTTVQDGATSLPTVEALTQAVESGEAKLPLDVILFPHIAQIEECKGEALYSPQYDGGLRVGGVKFVLDGSPQGRTAYLTEPYTLQAEGKAADYRGYPSMEPEAVNAMAAQCLENDIPMQMHANGDAAIDMAIASIEAAFGDDEVTDHRTVIIHAQLMRENQLDRVKQFGLIPSYYAAHPFFWGDWHRQIFGEARASRISPIRDTIDRDIPFVIHHDAPIIPPMAMRLIDIAVNRTTRSGFVLGDDQRATPYEALYAMTMGGAYQYGEEDSKGSITVGKRADFVILAANPLEVEPATLKDIAVIETIARGRSVYNSAK